MVAIAGVMRTRGWTADGFKLAAGNRENIPEPSAVAGRADRAAKNMLENMVLFGGVLLAAHLNNGNAGRIALGAQVFFYCRLAYWFIYLGGITGVRTLLWLGGVAGMAIIGSAAI